MSFIVQNYSTMSHRDLKNFSKFLQAALIENLPASVNMWHNDWPNHTNTLPYILNKTDRFKNNGEFQVVFHNENIIACGGIYTAPFDSTFAIAGARTWVSKPWRHKQIIREILLPYQRQWAIDKNFDAIGLSFNEYNKKLVYAWKRTRLGEHRTPRQQHHIFYRNFNQVPFDVNIQSTAQTLIYEKLIDSYSYDWNLIKS
jgi:hypothetical protein